MGPEDWNCMLNASLSAAYLSPRKLRMAVSLAEIGNIYHPHRRLRGWQGRTRACASGAVRRPRGERTVRPVRLQQGH